MKCDKISSPDQIPIKQKTQFLGTNNYLSMNIFWDTLWHLKQAQILYSKLILIFRGKGEEGVERQWKNLERRLFHQNQTSMMLRSCFEGVIRKHQQLTLMLEWWKWKSLDILGLFQYSTDLTEIKHNLKWQFPKQKNKQTEIYHTKWKLF